VEEAEREKGDEGSWVPVEGLPVEEALVVPVEGVPVEEALVAPVEEVEGVPDELFFLGGGHAEV